MADGPSLPPAYTPFQHIHRTWDSRHDQLAARLAPGEYYVTEQDEAITTTLGSCVSACIWDTLFAIGGMNHVMLPGEEPIGGDPFADMPAARSTRFGAYAMELLINDILSRGGSRRRLKAKICGGGDMGFGGPTIGRRNIAFVQRYLENEGIEIVSTDVGGTSPRQVYFFPKTGRLRVRKLHDRQSVVQQEHSFRDTLDRAPSAGSIELF
ncbi:MAG: chemoreceptor glutamine deamidase CheD [Bradymonadia bacterium]